MDSPKNFLYIEEEYGFLEEFLYEAIFKRDEDDPLPRDIIYKPELYAYINEFGKPDDHCIVSKLDNNIVGAVWVRLFTGEFIGYGRLDDHTPELSISVLPEYRGKGIGKSLLEGMIHHLRHSGYQRVSLSVTKENRALKLYRDLGFEVVRETDHDYLMKLEILNQGR